MVRVFTGAVEGRMGPGEREQVKNSSFSGWERFRSWGNHPGASNGKEACELNRRLANSSWPEATRMGETTSRAQSRKAVKDLLRSLSSSGSALRPLLP